MKIISFASAEDIKAKFEEIEVDWRAVDLMLDKFLFVTVEIPEVRNVEANIIKQEMLVLGGEAAVNRHAISCSVPTTPVLLAGTKKSMRRLIERLRAQNIGKLADIADELEQLLF